MKRGRDREDWGWRDGEREVESEWERRKGTGDERVCGVRSQREKERGKAS